MVEYFGDNYLSILYNVQNPHENYSGAPSATIQRMMPMNAKSALNANFTMPKVMLKNVLIAITH